MRVLAVYGARGRILYPTCENTQEGTSVSRVSYSPLTQPLCSTNAISLEQHWKGCSWEIQKPGHKVQGILLEESMETKASFSHRVLSWKLSVVLHWQAWAELAQVWVATRNDLTLDRERKQQQTPDTEASGVHLSGQLCLHWCLLLLGHIAQPHSYSESASLRRECGHATAGAQETSCPWRGQRARRKYTHSLEDEDFW